MKVLHISMECFPAAKYGGLGHVAGAFAIYLNRAEVSTAVIIPKFNTSWPKRQNFREVFNCHIRLDHEAVGFNILDVKNDRLGFPLYVANIPGKFDRPGIYGDPGGGWYGDEVERNLCFQQAVLKWVVSMKWKPEILHCHDHHTGLIPFMVKYCPAYNTLRNLPTVFTIHNGAYHGAFSWNDVRLLPFFKAAARGYLDWGNTICPLAAGIKCCWRLTTVSGGYLQELQSESNGMEALIRQEMPKARGIINGIDTGLWDPASDPLIAHPLEDDVDEFKRKNKNRVLDHFRIIPDLPIVTFIGRLVKEKGADIIPDTIRRTLGTGTRAGFVVLGTVDKVLMQTCDGLKEELPG